MAARSVPSTRDAESATAVGARAASEPGAREPRFPAPLRLLLVLVAIVAVAWAFLNPPWQVTDETRHFPYVQTLAELHHLPGGPGRAESSEQLVATYWMNSFQTQFNILANPEWTHAIYREWRVGGRAIPRDDGGGFNYAAVNPPAYYAYQAIPYLLGSGTDIFSRLILLRLAGALWLLVATVATWKLIGELFGRRQGLQLAGAATVGLWPMVSYVTVAVNPDGMVVGLTALALWLGVRTSLRGLTWRRGLALGAVVGLAVITKATSLALVPGAAAAVLIGLLRVRRSGWRLPIASGALAAVAFLVPVVGWRVLSALTARPAFGQAAVLGAGFDIHSFASYLWQYYLPMLPFQQKLVTVFPVISTFPLYNTWIGNGFATFGWTDVWFPPVWYRGFAAVTALVAVVSLWSLVRRLLAPDRLRVLAPLAVIVLTVGALLAGLHWTDYQNWRIHAQPFMSGRYLMPLMPVAGVAVAAALRAFRGRLAGALTGTWLAFLLLFQLAALGLIVDHYYT
jgi:4-amino-4-deoxy-L-arabinose transferase-like glycosyltransferase